MRDPLSSNSVVNNEFRRNLYQDLSLDSFLHTHCAKKMVLSKELVPFTIADKRTIISPLIPFVSYPYEWCNAQFIIAAKHTLSIASQALAAGYEIKDASAWNIVFNGCQPIFCDHLSFEINKSERWWAFGQFTKHFIFPLCLHKYRNLNANETFKLSRDGMDPETARTLIGFKRFFTRYWPLMMKARTKQPKLNDAPSQKTTKPMHKNLFVVLRWFLKALSIKDVSKSNWSTYTSNRNHYAKSTAKLKYATVDSWLQDLRPSWVTDLGCNTGEFSKLSVKNGAKVVAVDFDHDSIQRLFVSDRNKSIFPVIANLDDFSGGRGWGGSEFPGLLQRLEEHSDVLLMLALVHHLAISIAIPYERIAELASKLTSRYLIIEMIDSTDHLAKRLAAQRNRNSQDFSIKHQKDAFFKFFNPVQEVVLPNSNRVIILMDKL